MCTKPACIVCKLPGTLTAEGIYCDLHACRNVFNPCGVESPNKYTCTLAEGHIRPHVAHGAGLCDVWTDEAMPFTEMKETLIDTIKAAIASASMDTISVEWEGVTYLVTAHSIAEMVIRRKELETK